MDTLTHKPFEELTDDEIVAHLHVQDAERVFCVYEALKRGIDHETIYRITKIDWWFLDKMQQDVYKRQPSAPICPTQRSRVRVCSSSAAPPTAAQRISSMRSWPMAATSTGCPCRSTNGRK